MTERTNDCGDTSDERARGITLKPLRSDVRCPCGDPAEDASADPPLCGFCANELRLMMEQDQ